MTVVRSWARQFWVTAPSSADVTFADDFHNCYRRHDSQTAALFRCLTAEHDRLLVIEFSIASLILPGGLLLGNKPRLFIRGWVPGLAVLAVGGGCARDVSVLYAHTPILPYKVNNHGVGSSVSLLLSAFAVVRWQSSQLENIVEGVATQSTAC